MTTAAAVHAAMRALPIATLDEILGAATPVILAPHQDDEVIGCGGLIAALVQREIQPLIVFVTDGSGSHPGSRKVPPPALATLREQEARDAAAILGVRPDRLSFLATQDTAAPHAGTAFDAVVEEICRIVGPHRPAVLLASWGCDPHCDHLAVHLMAARAAAILGARHLTYPVWGWTLPAEHDLGEIDVAGWRFPVADQTLKLRALHAHRSQVSDLIDDDPDGFRLDAATLSAMLHDHETFLVNR